MWLLRILIHNLSIIELIHEVKTTNTELFIAPGSDMKKMDQLMSLDTTVPVRLLYYISRATSETKCF